MKTHESERRQALTLNVKDGHVFHELIPGYWIYVCEVEQLRGLGLAEVGALVVAAIGRLLAPSNPATVH